MRKLQNKHGNITHKRAERSTLNRSVTTRLYGTSRQYSEGKHETQTLKHCPGMVSKITSILPESDYFFKDISCILYVRNKFSFHKTNGNSNIQMLV